jgi:predicted DNA-binding protein (MmcQ/YjbR family)
MSFQALADHAAAFPGVTLDVKWGNDWVASVGGKMFFVGGPHPGRWTHCSFKVDDHRFLELTGVPGFKPAPYAARYRWVQMTDAQAGPAAVRAQGAGGALARAGGGEVAEEAEAEPGHRSLRARSAATTDTEGVDVYIY